MVSRLALSALVLSCAGPNSEVRSALDRVDAELAELSDAYTLWREAQHPETEEDLRALDAVEEEWDSRWEALALACDELQAGRLPYASWWDAYQDARRFLLRIGALP